ncbi:predicted protein [Streptomyces filamentosus NRRL 15998]|uniref:Predicted protein n=1 Tax=Streptomyces filamentosus NRRL 15998 TaxID=457431 RepID=D6AVE5_STRFL|nr:predicted protein [Streptomyces filamentosus NRRL 15998]
MCSARSAPTRSGRPRWCGLCWYSRTRKSPADRRSTSKSYVHNQHEHPDTDAHQAHDLPLHDAHHSMITNPVPALLPAHHPTTRTTKELEASLPL